MTSHLRTLTLVTGVALLSACSDSDNNGDSSSVDPNTDTSYSEINLNASAGGFGADPNSPENKAVYFNLDRGEVVDLSDLQALLSTDWHIGLKRTNTFFNGGHSGPGEVQSAIIESQENYYDSEGNPDNNVFLNALATAEIATFEKASVTDQNFSLDTPKPTITSDGSETSWWSYNSTTHTLEAAPNNWSVIRSAGGDSYAKLHVTAIDTATRAVTVELFIQPLGASSFSTTATQWQAIIGAQGGALCWDIETTAEVDCDSQADVWDLRVEISADGRAWTLWTNGGAYGDSNAGAALSDLDATTLATYAGASEVPGFFSDSVSNAVEDNAWYAYNLQSQHKLWPNYRVYAVATGDGIYKIQMTGYYSPDSGTSGYITLRHEQAE